MSDNKSYENLVNEEILERQARDKQLYEAALAKRVRDQAKSEEESKIVAESEKQYAKIHSDQQKAILFYGLDSETSKNLEKLLALSSQLCTIGQDQYDPNNKKKLEIQAQIDVLKGKITESGRNLGDIAFTKKTYYQSVTKDYFIFPDREGNYRLFAGELGAFRTTDRSLQVDEKGHPIKIFKPDRIQTSPEIPIIDYETVVLKEKEDLPLPIRTKPHKPLFRTQNVDPKENLAEKPQNKFRDNKRNWISGK